MEQHEWDLMKGLLVDMRWIFFYLGERELDEEFNKMKTDISVLPIDDKVRQLDHDVNVSDVERPKLRSVVQRSKRIVFT